MNQSAEQSRLNPAVDRNQFGTFGGVFTPSILTILGVIMFMRAGFVVGQAGILGAIGILLIAKAITLLTTLSVGAISTNTPVKGGGAYFLISRVLGPEFGGAIGIALYFAQAISVPFYVLGFTEALARSFPVLAPYFQWIAIGSTAVLFIIAYVGANWAIRTQYFIMAILGLSIFSFLGGALLLFDPANFASNLGTGYTSLEPNIPGGGDHSFWIVFAIYFPAVTGIFAGINMSGDLKDPAKSIPRGTLAAVWVGLFIYLLQILLIGGAFDRATLIARPFETLKDNALLGGYVTVAGVFAASLSSALGSLLGAPRILQAVSRDRIIDVIRPFAKGAKKGDEPRRAMILTGILAVLVLLWAGNEAEGGALNIVASIITMIFLYAYGMTNLAAFTEAFGSNPSFRPRFRFFHWFTGLLGAAGCVITTFLIDPIAAVGAFLMIGLFLWYVKRRELRASFGDARRGLLYTALRRNLISLSRMKEDPKNWRPTILVFSGNPDSRETLVSYAVWLEAGRGIVFLANVLEGSYEEYGPRRKAAEQHLGNFCREKGIQAFPVVTVAKEVEEGMAMLLQTVSIGPVRPNLTVFGWHSDSERIASFCRYLRIASSMDQGLLLLHTSSVPVRRIQKRIDLWWRGRKNGSLMVILAHLMTHNWEWADSDLRLIRVVEREAGREPTIKALEELLQQARVEGTAEVIVSTAPFEEIFHETSSDASCIFLGFDLPEEGQEEAWHTRYENLLTGMPATILICSTGSEDMLA